MESRRSAGHLAALFPACPRRMKGVDRRQEMTFALVGQSGRCPYYLLENIALTYTGIGFTPDEFEEAVYLFQDLFILRPPVELFLPCVFSKCDLTHAP